MTIFKFILILIISPFVLGFCYMVGSFFTDFLLGDNKNKTAKVPRATRGTNTFIKIIIGIVIIFIINKVMEGAGCSSNDDKYFKL